MKGLGTDEKGLIKVLCHRSANQRAQIANIYKTMYGKDLIKDLTSETSGKLELLLQALMYAGADYDAYELHHAMSGIGTDESTLIEILASRTPHEIREIKEAYQRMYGKDLEKALESETSGHFKRLLISLSTGGRNETLTIDRVHALKQAQDLHSAGVKKWFGTDESTFNAIMCAENYAQLQTIFGEYQKLAKHDIEEAIHKEFSGDIEAGLSAVVKCVKNRPAYFAERLHDSMAGMGTKDRTLIRIIVSRSEKDMVQIKQEFQRLYGKALDKAVAGDTSGKYEDALLALLGGK